MEGSKRGAEGYPPNASPWTRAGLGAIWYGVLRWILKGLLTLCCRLEVIGEKHIPDCGPVILAANHASQMDPLVLGAAIQRRFTFLAAAELLTMPILGPLVRPFHPVPVRRGRFDLGAIRECLENLRRGGALLIFPEGKISTDGRLQPPHEGLAFLAHHTGVPVIPIGIRGTYQVWPLGTRWPHRGRITVHIGSAIVPDRRSHRETRDVLTARVMEAIADLAGETRSARAEPTNGRGGRMAPATGTGRQDRLFLQRRDALRRGGAAGVISRLRWAFRPMPGRPRGPYD
ncbi:MAG TPA: lysophospholipid acyltransferase family protein [bacterium]|nr:lysophospholipid acyltransferase family protein [bacterium]